MPLKTRRAVADAYESYSEKTFTGETYPGVLRRTFLIDEEGRIRRVFDKVKVESHAAEILRAFAE